MILNQTKFEIARDIVILLKSLKNKECVYLKVVKNNNLFHWRTDQSKAMKTGSKEIAIALQKAYELKIDIIKC